MILIKITGGPGNQLFQYAFGRQLAIKNKTELFLDLSEYEIKKHRRFLLDKFNIKANYAGKNILKTYLKFSYYVTYDLRPKIHRLLPFLFKNIVYEKHFHFDKEMLAVKNNKYLIGFWQSEKYFSEIKQLLRKDFTLKNDLSSKSKKILEEINNTNSVSINIRRGDYLQDPAINKRHGVIGLSYFKKAISYVETKIKRPHYFLFSDDIAWVKKNIKPVHPSTYIDFNFPARDDEDLILASQCRHHILTNSTFSWWVAWINQNKNKITVAPSKWFNQLNYDTRDLYPENWVIIS